MTTRLVAGAAMLWLFFCVPYFAVGHAFLDPSGDYSPERESWVAISQWIALLGPPLALWMSGRLFAARATK